MMPRLPVLAIVLGVAGVIPFVACGVGALGPATPTRLIMLQGLVGYGAVILSFLGAVHWGIAFASPAAPAVTRGRLALGVVPALVGWVSLLFLTLLQPWAALAMQIAGFVAVAVVEQRARGRGLVPPAYLVLRLVLSGLVLAVLITVLALRLIGATIAL